MFVVLEFKEFKEGKEVKAECLVGLCGKTNGFNF